MGGFVEEMLPQFHRRDIGSPRFHILGSSTLDSCLQALFLPYSTLFPPMLSMRCSVTLVFGNELRITLADEFFVEAPASHHVIVRKCDGVEAHLFAELLVPQNTLVGHAQELFGRRPAHAFKFRK